MATDIDDLVCEPEITPEVNTPVVKNPPFNNFYGNKDGGSELNAALDDSYLLVLDLPCGLKKINALTRREQELLCLESLQINVFSANIPGSSIGVNTVNVPGGSLKYSKNKRAPYEPLNLGFVVDSDFQNYWLLNKWLDIRSEAGTGNSLVSRDSDYKTNFTLIVLNEYKCGVAKFVFNGAFLSSIGTITYNDTSEGQMVSSEAVFEYDYHEMFLLDPDEWEKLNPMS